MFERILMTNTGGGKSPKVETGPIYSSPILASDGGVDWLGEVSASDFITGDSLASLIGLTAGVSQYSDAGWLHVGLDGTELLIAKRPLRRSLYWSDINSVNSIFGNRIVTINGQDYKIRLLKGANSNPPLLDLQGFDVEVSHGSEWNRILYRLSDNNFRNSLNSKASEEPFINLANYTETDLALDNNVATGSACYCQERYNNLAIYRGYNGVSRYWRWATGSNPTNYGWRPVLEKV